VSSPRAYPHRRPANVEAKCSCARPLMRPLSLKRQSVGPQLAGCVSHQVLPPPAADPLSRVPYSSAGCAKSKSSIPISIVPCTTRLRSYHPYNSPLSLALVVALGVEGYSGVTGCKTHDNHFRAPARKPSARLSLKGLHSPVSPPPAPDRPLSGDFEIPNPEAYESLPVPLSGDPRRAACIHPGPFLPFLLLRRT